ncbi:MAG: cytochrome c biogenesis protein [Planctomycetaceae bacterium]|nr:cytochrome c biogenesis protein [Planctomycetaceae bacterium]
MAFLANVHLSCFLLSYLVAMGGELFQLLRKPSSLVRGILITVAAAGLVAHTSYLVARSKDSGLPPLVGSSHDWLLVLAWLVAVIYLITVCFQARIAVSLFVLPWLIALVTMAVFVEDAKEAVDRVAAAHRWGMLHASTLVLGMGTVVAATLCALMYLIQFRRLRGGKSWLQRLRLPNLEQLTAINRSLVISTVILLTIGLVTGVILGTNSIKDETSSFRWSDPIVVSTSIIWLLMVVCLGWLLKKKEQTGRQVARLTFFAGAFLLLTIFGLILLTGGVHGRSDDPAQTAHSDSASLFRPEGANG